MIKNLFKKKNVASKTVEKQRRPPVTPQNFNYDEHVMRSLRKQPKSKEEEMLILSALENNDFLSSLLDNQNLQEVVDCMYLENVKPNQIIIEEGGEGGYLYISITGTYEIIQNEDVINTFSDVRVFGELALLYNAPRLATIKARTAGKLFILDRHVFKHLLAHPDHESLKDIVSFLKEVPKLNTVAEDALEHVATLVELKFFPPGTTIVEEGEVNPDKFYIIRAGSVTVTKKNVGPIDKLYKGSFFGELALLKQKVRQATVTADPPGTECFILSRKDFIAHFGNIHDFFSINIQTQPYKPVEEIIEHADMKLDCFEVVSTIGRGCFSEVKLVRHASKKIVFVLRRIAKQVIVDQKLKERVFNERNIQISCKNNFIVRLYRTYKDTKYLYFLLEPCLGGDLWSHLHKRTPSILDNGHAQFYAACVIEAFAYLHERNIIYRNLKPENILIDAKGYAKLTDFGFAKKLEVIKKSIKKTYTFVGTPECIAPEIILARGHDKAVDYWALGVFISELLLDWTPFRSDDVTHMKTYKLILKGIDGVAFPDEVPVEAEDLIRKLCRLDPSKRLGSWRIEHIMSHDWFEDFDWEKLRNCTLPAPFRPNLSSNVDVHYFGSFPGEEEVYADDTSGWDENF